MSTATIWPNTRVIRGVLAKSRTSPRAEPTFQDAVTSELFHGAQSKRVGQLPMDVVKRARRKLDMVNAAANLEDLKVPPGNQLEKLKGDLSDHHSIRVNQQWRIIFIWKDAAAHKVQFTDYH